MMDYPTLPVRHFVDSLAASVAAATLTVLGLGSSAAQATELWMFASPRVVKVAPGWEGLRTDAGDMWKPDAPWQTVAQAVKVIQFSPINVDRAREADLQEAVADIKRRNIELAVATSLLVRSDRCRAKNEAYGEPGALDRMFDKLRRDGADVKYVTMDEPFFYGHRDSGPTACHESAEALAQAIAENITIVRKYFPKAQVGTDEVLDDSKPWVQELLEWTDTYKRVTGEPLAYIHADLTWTPGAVRNLVALAAGLKQRHVPFGVIYDSDRPGNKSDQAWMQGNLRDFTRVEVELGVHPDHAAIETWVRVPTRMLPENQPGTFTNVVLQYIQFMHSHPH